ncbi:hypothetical protein TNCV_2573971 [Trichonephila clavipes]|nr:hypothetical protein TNCV_2573971 [Trichonephila clavipes]
MGCQEEGRKQRRITRIPRVRDTRAYQRQSTPWEKEKITRAPRDCDTRTHLKKVWSAMGLIRGIDQALCSLLAADSELSSY